MVNPPIAGQLAECFCTNNWSDYHSGGCQTTNVYHYTPTSYKQTYTSACGSGQIVQWGLLTYGMTTPLDSNVVVQAHTADTSGGLGPPLTTLITAKATPLPDTQQCSVAGPSPCPIVFYSALGEIPSHRNVLELVFTLNPSSDGTAGPIVNHWEVTYSCSDAM
jgi:hypothetical protein